MHLNIPALLVCSVVSLALGFVWFSILFGKRYGCEADSEARKPTAEEKKARAGMMGRAFSIYIAGSVVTAWAYAVCLNLWRLAAPGHAPDDLGAAAAFSLLLWAGFFAPFAVGKVIWMGKSWAVAAIEASYEFVRIGLMLLILWYWR